MQRHTTERLITQLKNALYFLDENQLIVTMPLDGEAYRPLAHDIPKSVWEARWALDEPRLKDLGTIDNVKFYFDPARGRYGLIVTYLEGSRIPHVPPLDVIPQDIYRRSLDARNEYLERSGQNTATYTGISDALLASVEGLGDSLETLAGKPVTTQDKSPATVWNKLLEGIDFKGF